MVTGSFQPTTLQRPHDSNYQTAHPGANVRQQTLAQQRRNGLVQVRVDHSTVVDDAQQVRGLIVDRVAARVEASFLDSHSDYPTRRANRALRTQLRATPQPFLRALRS